MKQKEIVIDPSLGFEAEEMIRKYFATQTVNEIEGFVYSEEEILIIYKNTYTFNNLRCAKYHAIYTVDRCDNCSNRFEVTINNRRQLHYYLKASHHLCNGCKLFQASTSRMIGFELEGDILW